VIIGSLLLILVAVGLLVLGLAQGSSALLVASIAASLLAAVALVTGARQAAAARAGARSAAGRADAEPAATGFGADDGYRPRGDGFPIVDEPIGATVGDQAEAYLAEPAYAGHPHDGRSRDGALAETEPHHGSGAYAPAPVQEPAYPELVVEPQRTATIPAQEYSAEPAGDADPGDDADPIDEPAPQLVPAATAARVARMSTEVLVIDARPRYHLPGCVHLLGRSSEPLPVSEAVELGFTPCGLCEPDSALLADARRV
jgi:hypothetical protein